jgi:hypothetical protein
MCTLLCSGKYLVDIVDESARKLRSAMWRRLAEEIVLEQMRAAAQSRAD